MKTHDPWRDLMRDGCFSISCMILIGVGITELPSVAGIILTGGGFFILGIIASSLMRTISYFIKERRHKKQLVKENGLIDMKETAELCNISVEELQKEVEQRSITCFFLGDEIYFRGEHIMEYREQQEKKRVE